MLELFAQDLHVGLDGAVRDKQQELVRFVEKLWDKYRVAMGRLIDSRTAIEQKLSRLLEETGYK